MPREETGLRRPLESAAAIAVAIAALLIAWSGPARASDAGGHVPSADDRYSLANGCFALRSLQTGDYVAKAGGGYAATAATPAAAEPFRMQATDLGRYLFYGPTPDFMARNLLNAVAPAATPSDDSDWTVNEAGSAFRIVNEFTGRDLAVGGAGTLTTVAAGSGGAAGLFDFEPASGCADYPEVEVNVDGPLPRTGSPDSPVRGMIETHMHQMAYEFLSTKAHCGRPWHRFGAPEALKDCQDHVATNGCGAILEAALSGTTCHDPGGWPSFAGWPEHYQYTHEQSYYKWLERSWRAGLRIFVNLAVENRVLCELYDVQVAAGPPSPHGCNEMNTVRRELQRMQELQDYIDAQNGGPGEGWYRIVGSPAEARAVIADGKLAVIPGMEVSEPFNCRLIFGTASACTQQQMLDGIDEIYDLGVRQVEIVNKFDNSLTGVAGDSGTTGTATNLGNFYSAGTFWDYEGCTGDNPELNHDHSPTTLSHNDDAVIANGLDALGDTTGITFPIYGSPPHCNQRGLSTLGEAAINKLIAKGMVFDPDHMSVLARNKALDVVEDADYGGVMTSHSWSTDNALPRISALGGFIGPAAKSPQKFINDWAHMKTHGYDAMNPYLFGLGYGADMNGFASQGGPPPADAQISYPFTSPIDRCVTVDKQVSGQRTFDFNADGTSHYGLYPDWTEAVRVAGGDAIINDLANGAEAYLQMWERATGAPTPTGTAAGGSCGGSDGGPGGGAGGGQQPSGKGAATDRCAPLRAKLKRAKALGKPRKVQRKLRRKLRRAGCKIKKKKKKGKKRKGAR